MFDVEVAGWLVWDNMLLERVEGRNDLIFV